MPLDWIDREAATKYAKDASGHEHAPAGSSEGGQFVADEIDDEAASTPEEDTEEVVGDIWEKHMPESAMDDPKIAELARQLFRAWDMPSGQDKAKIILPRVSKLAADYATRPLESDGQEALGALRKIASAYNRLIRKK